MEQIWTNLLAFSADQRVHWKVSLIHQIMQRVSFAYVALILLSGRNQRANLHSTAFLWLVISVIPATVLCDKQIIKTLSSVRNTDYCWKEGRREFGHILQKAFSFALTLHSSPLPRRYNSNLLHNCTRSKEVTCAETQVREFILRQLFFFFF